MNEFNSKNEANIFFPTQHFIRNKASEMWHIYCAMFISYKASWCHDMEMLSTLLAICEANPHFAVRFPSQRASNMQYNPIAMSLQCKNFSFIQC